MHDRETLLAEVNQQLAPLERRVCAGFEGPRHPVLFVVGAPRSGHTLLSQLLARSGRFGYVDNFVARFWMAPAVAARLQQSIGLDRAADLASRPPASRQGRTSGWAEPHEFGNFLRRWIPDGESDRAPDQRLEPDRRREWRAEVGALEAILGGPLFFRNLVYGQNVPIVRAAFPGAHFLICRRRVSFQAQSILEARAARPGRAGDWWSLRPEGWRSFEAASPAEQVLAQIEASYARIDRDLAGHPARRLAVRYEDVCQAPRTELARIAGWLGEPERWDGRGASVSQELPQVLECADRVRLPRPEWERLRALARERFPEEAL